jgi:uncharacterized protein (DUF4415 family)
MKRKSISNDAKREIRALKRRPDSEIDFTDIPRQNLDDPRWKNAVVGKYYRPIKTPVSVRIDNDVLAWLKSKGEGHIARINEILRNAMNTDLRR